MAIDLALSTGGQRQSRSSRSGTAQVAVGEVTEQRRDFSREQVRSGRDPRVGSAAGGLADALGSFFPGLIKEANARELAQIKKENAEEAIRIENAVREDRDGAREAIATKDFSKFIPNDEFRSREVLQNVFRSVTAQTLAHEDFENDLKLRIKDTAPSGDPDDTVETFLNEQLEGADEIFKQAYGQTISKLSQKEVADFRQSRLELHQLRAESTATELIKDEIANGVVPVTAEGLMAMRSKVIGFLPMNAPDKVMRADAIVDNTLITMAAGDGPGAAVALKLAAYPDPNRDGTSVMTRPATKDKYQAAVNKQIQARRRTKTLAAHEDLEGLEERLARVDENPDDNLSDIHAGVLAHLETHGDSEAYDTLRNNVRAAMKAKGSNVANYRMIARGQMPVLSTGQWNKQALGLWNGEGLAEMVKEGLTPEAAEVRVMQVLAQRGSGSTLMAHNSAVLLGGTDPEQLRQSYARIQALDLATDRKMEGLHLDGDATGVYHLMNSAAKSNPNDPEAPFKALEQFRTAMDAAADGGGDPAKHYESRVDRPGSKFATTKGKVGSMQLGSKAWDAFSQKELESDGFLARNTFGIIGGQSKPDFDELAPVAQDRIVRMVNIASFLLSTKSASDDEIMALTTELIRGEFGLELDLDGNKVVTIDQTPTVAVGADGSPLPGAAVDAVVLDRALETLQLPEHAALLMAMGGVGTIGQDPLTKQGQGLVVQSIANGFSQDVNLTPGRTMVMPFADLPPELPNTFFENVEADLLKDRLSLTIPLAPGPGENPRKYITDALFMYYNDVTKSWTLRYADTGATKMSLAELSAKNAAARAEDATMTDFDRATALRASVPANDPFKARAGLFPTPRAPPGV